MPNLKERYNTLRAKLAGWLPESDLVKIDSTFEFARRVHAGERRASGEMYIRHPLAVAEILSPGGTVVPGSVIQPCVKVHNFGTGPTISGVNSDDVVLLRSTAGRIPLSATDLDKTIVASSSCWIICTAGSDKSSAGT